MDYEIYELNAVKIGVNKFDIINMSKKWIKNKINFN